MNKRIYIAPIRQRPQRTLKLLRVKRVKLLPISRLSLWNAYPPKHYTDHAA